MGQGGIRETDLIRNTGMHLIAWWLDILGRGGAILTREQPEEQLPDDPLALWS